MQDENNINDKAGAVKAQDNAQDGAICYKCDKMCTKRWAIDESFVVCMSCGSLLKAPIIDQP
jgi:hypothetical protein